MHAALPADHFTVFGPLTLDKGVGFLLPTLLLLIGNQGMYQKFFSARIERDAKLAVFGWIIGTLVLETTIITIAVIGSAACTGESARDYSRHGATGSAADAGRDSAGRHIRQGHLDSEQLSVLSGQ